MSVASLTWHRTSITAAFGLALIAIAGCTEPSKTAPTSEAASSPAPSPHGDFYTVDHYDVARNAAEDLAMTARHAQAEHKNILIQVGGDWCGWCKLMSKFIETNEAVREKIRANYVVMKVTYDPNQRNVAFLSQFPEIHGYPHLFVVDPNGKLLHSQDTAKLEEGHGYGEQAYLAFLDQWKPGR